MWVSEPNVTNDGGFRPFANVLMDTPLEVNVVRQFVKPDRGVPRLLDLGDGPGRGWPLAARVDGPHRRRTCLAVHGVSCDE